MFSRVTNAFAMNKITNIFCQTYVNRVLVTVEYYSYFSNRLDVRQFSQTPFNIFG